MSTLIGGAAPQLRIPRATEIKEFLYKNAVMGETKRFRRLDRCESFYKTCQYNHQQYDWWGYPADNMETISSEIQVPLGFTQPALALSVRQKRPTAPFNLAKAIIDRFTGLLFSETRKPTIWVENDQDTEDFLLAAIEQMRFWAKMREARSIGGSSGTVVVTIHLRDGNFAAEVHNPKHCTVVWKDRRTHTPAAILKMYKYPVEEDVVDDRGEYKGTTTVDYLYRRIITEDDDTVFKPVKMVPGASMAWIPEDIIQHNLGFFPGVWIQNLPVLDDIDGDPDCQGIWQNLDTIDRILSQMNKAVLLNLDPTLALNYDPKEVEMMGGVYKGSDHSLQLGTKGSAHYVEISGSGVSAGMTVYNTILDNTLKVARCVFVDPSTISGSAQSAKAIEYIYAPMLEKADDLRAQYGDLGVIPLLTVIEKMARKYWGKTVKTENGIGKFAFKLPPKTTVEPVPPDSPPGTLPKKTTEERKLGPGGFIRLKWGPYFSPTESDKSQAIQNIVAAKTGSLIDHETAVVQGSPIFGLRDPQSIFQKVKQEQEEQQSMAFGGMDFGGGRPVEEESADAGAGEGDNP